MHKFFALIGALCFIFGTSLPTRAALEPSQIKSLSYVVMDAQTGQVLLSQNPDQQMFPASITKIMTCALALQQAPAGKTTTMSKEAVFNVPRDTTHIALTDGELLPVTDLLEATMIQSANDAANGLAEFVSGNLTDFAAKMTQSAREAGAKNTNFSNASGLFNSEHYTTAYDMAMITRWALTIDGFRALFGQKDCTVAPTNKQPVERTFTTKHKMLQTDSSFYDARVTGGKLGWIPEAGHTLVTVANANGMEVICVVMDSKNADEKFTDTKLLLDEAFKSFRQVSFAGERFLHPPIPVMDGDQVIGNVVLTPTELVLNRPSNIAKADISLDIQVPIRYQKGDPIEPTARFFYNGALLCAIPLSYELTDVSAVPMQAAAQPQGNTPFPWPPFLVAALALIVAVLFSIRARNLYRREQRRKQRRRIQDLEALHQQILNQLPSEQPPLRVVSSERRTGRERTGSSMTRAQQPRSRSNRRQG